MPTNIFPQGAPHRIAMPVPEYLSPLNGQVPSWRVLFTKEVVPVFTVDNAEAADDEGYFPISAAYLCATGCRPTACEDAIVFIDDGISRCALYLNEATIKPANSSDVQTAQLVEFKLKVSIEGIGGTLFHGSFLVKPVPGLNTRSTLRGLLAEVSGILGTQFEVWARVKSIINPQPVEVRFQMIMDRLGGAAFAYPGDTAGGHDLPPPCCTGTTGPTGLTGP